MHHPPTCMRCHVIMACSKTGVHLELMAGAEPYQLWSADLYRCKGCGAEVTGGFAKLPIAEHYQKSYAEWAKALKPVRYWSTFLERDRGAKALAEIPEI